MKKIFIMICLLAFCFSSSSLVHASSMNFFLDMKVQQEHNHGLSDHGCCDENSNHDRDGSCIEHCIGDYDTIVVQSNKTSSKEFSEEKKRIVNSFESPTVEGNKIKSSNKGRGPPDHISISPYKNFVGITILLI